MVEARIAAREESARTTVFEAQARVVAARCVRDGFVDSAVTKVAHNSIRSRLVSLYQQIPASAAMRRCNTRPDSAQLYHLTVRPVSWLHVCTGLDDCLLTMPTTDVHICLQPAAREPSRSCRTKLSLTDDLESLLRREEVAEAQARADAAESAKIQLSLQLAQVISTGVMTSLLTWLRPRF